MIKYRIAWYMAVVLSFVFYYTGIVNLYEVVRKRLFKNYRTIIVMYHRVRDDMIEPEISVSTSRFEEQIKYIKNKYNIVTLMSAVYKLKNKEKIEQDELVVTFDDGFRDNYENGYPILKKYDVPATIFLISNQVGNEADMLSMEQILEMNASSIDFGSHTRTHPILSTLDIDSASEEISKSKKELEKLLGEKIFIFAYPKGKKNIHYNDSTVELVKIAGYQAAVTTNNGDAKNSNNIYEINRLGVRNFPLFVIKTRLSGIFESLPFKCIRMVMAVK